MFVCTLLHTLHNHTITIDIYEKHLGPHTHLDIIQHKQQVIIKYIFLKVVMGVSMCNGVIIGRHFHSLEL